MKTILTVIGKDQTGIIAGISQKLYELNINILDVSQTIMDEYFTMIMLLDLSKINATFDEVKNTLVGDRITAEFGIPIINKRISVTPISLIAGASDDKDYVAFAKTLDEAAKAVGVNFIGGFSALVQKGYHKGDEILIKSIPQALAQTERVCSSVNVGSTQTGINMDAVKQMGQIIKEAAALTADNSSMACAKLVVFANAV